MLKHYIQYKMVNGDIHTFEEKHEELISATKISLVNGEKRFALHGDTLINLEHAVIIKFSERDTADDISAMSPEELEKWL